MRIIGYTFEADCHCVPCTAKRFPCPPVNSEERRVDKNRIIWNHRDREGNPIHPMFSTDEHAGSQFCGDCHERIE